MEKSFAVNPRLNTGKGVTGAVLYALGEGRDPKTGELKQLPPGGKSRVDWISGQGSGFDINTTDDAHLARRVMEFDALNQASRTRKCEQDCVHLTLSWRPGETPRKDLGMGNAKAIFTAHNDEDYAHVHIVASKINPDTGRAYDLEKSWRKLSTWAENYEREHGGVISLRRQDANELRAAIKDRDAEGVLDALTKQRSTFTGRQLEQALAKEMKNNPIEQAQFANQILSHAQTIHLADKPAGPVTRYTTRTVLEAELYVLRAAEGLASNKEHAISDGERARVLNGTKFEGITREQARAFRHATGAEGLAIIDGQSGTGKSFTMAAIRETYEKAGYRVIGLSPTNPVAEDMRQAGYRHADTIHSELFALNNNRTSWNRRTVIMVDEAAMIDTKLMAMVTAHANEAGAKLILAGDDRQLSSIDRGGMFGALKDRHGCAELREVKRQHKIDERRASEWMASGNFQDALGIYEQKGAIHWTRTQGEARAGLVEQWAKDSAASPDKSRFVFAYTNDAVAALNAALRAVRKERGELGEDHQLDTAHGRDAFAKGERIQFTSNDKRAGLFNGNAGTIEKIDGTEITLKLDGRKPKTIRFDAGTFDNFRHGYAGTIYRGQGRTLDQTYLYHSEHWRSAPSYVGMTRHREKTDIFVATNTLDTPRQGGVAPDRAAHLSAPARQMGRVDERRAASMFYHQQDIGPVRPLTAKELLAKFGDTLRPRDRRAAQAAQQQTPQRSVQNNEPPEIGPQQPAETRHAAASRDERTESARDVRQRTTEQTQTTDSEETEKAAKLNNPERQRQASHGHGRSRSR